MKVTTKDGKLLYAIRAGKLLTINADHAQLSKFEGVIIDSKGGEEGSIDKKENPVEDMKVIERCVEPTSIDAQPEQQGIENSEEVNDIETVDDPIETVDNHQERTEQAAELGKGKVNVKDLRKADVIKYKRKGEREIRKGELTGRAGKVGGINEHWWNVKDIDTGHIQAEDTRTFEELEKVEIDLAQTEELALAVNIPRWRHFEARCVEAKKAELEMFDKYDVYEEVEDEGQARLGTMWLLTEKIKAGKTVVKARLNIRGDNEDTSKMRKDSPTVRKGNIKIVLMIAATKHWEIKTSDVSNAFLQGVPIEREVFVTPPKERRVPGTIWKLKKTVYGLADASRGFFLSFSGEIQDLGCEKSLLDPALYIYCPSSQKHEEEKEPAGLAVTHVDDILHAGEEEFEEKVMKPLKKSFKFGSEENYEFKYVGLNINQTEEMISIDQDHYVEALEGPDMEVCEHEALEEVMGQEGQTEFRSIIGKLAHVGQISRPDVVFEAKALSSKFGKATKKDLKIAMKKIQKLKSRKAKMVFPDLGNMKDWVLVGHGDAGIKSMPDKITSVGGQVIMMVNKETRKTCVLGWRSRKLKRKVISSLAGEALAMAGTIGEIVYTKAVLSQILGIGVDKVPVIIVTDSKNLEEAVYSTKLVDDPWLIPDIAIIKEAMEQGTVEAVKRVSSEDMLANCLTKQGASAEGLMSVMMRGEYSLPDQGGRRG